MSYEVVMVRLINGTFNAFSYYFSFYALNILLFYSFAHQVLPFALRKKRYAYFLVPCGIIVSLCIYYGFTLILDTVLRTYKNDNQIFSKEYLYTSFLKSLYRFLLFIGFSTGYHYLFTFLKEHRRAEEKEKEKLLAEIKVQHTQNELVKAQNALLKAQINPHFLFNTLNYIFTITRKHAPKAAQAIMSLSEIMRFSIDSGSSREESEILLELEQVENLIKIYRLRWAEPFYIDVDFSPSELVEVKIIPLIIITLVENIFKHGNLERSDRPAKVKIDYTDGVLQIVTENYGHDRATIRHNIGLQNVQKRLQIAYGERVVFVVDHTTPEIFKTILTIS